MLQGIKDITNGSMADFVIETSGTVEGAQQALDMIQKDGRICYLGIYRKLVPLDLEKLIIYNLKFIGSRGEGQHAIERIIPLLTSGRLNFRKMITHKFRLVDINDAFYTFVNRIDGALSVIVNP